MNDKTKIEVESRTDQSSQFELLVSKPFYTDEYCQIYKGDAREYVGCFKPELILTDPPYPNNANHFMEGIEAAKSVLQNETCDHFLVFWDELQEPKIKLPLVAKHIWYRNNSNRPDNYEMVYEFNKDGKKKSKPSSSISSNISRTNRMRRSNRTSNTKELQNVNETNYNK